MEEKKKTNWGLLLFVLVLVVCNIGFGGYFVYENFFKENEIKDNSEQKSIDVENSEGKYEELSIDSSVVKMAYDIIPSYDGFLDYESAYQSKKIYVNTLSPEYLRSFAFKKLDKNNIPKEPLNLTNGDIEESCLDESCFVFDAKILQDKMLELYNIKVMDGFFKVSLAEPVSYENGKYSYLYGGGTGLYSTVLREISKAYIIDDELIIEDNYLYLISTPSNDYDGSEVNIYTSSDKRTRISTEKDFTSEAELAEVKTRNMSKAQKYKHVFKKNDNGNYYWFSTEPVL